MLVDLVVGYCDTDSADLGWSLDLGPQAALAVRCLEIAPFDVEVRLLGASHQVAVRWAGPGGTGRAPGAGPGTAAGSAPFSPRRGAVLCRETVACIPLETTPLPDTAVRENRQRVYSFSCAVRAVDEAEFGRTVARLEADAASGLVGRYPGAAGALTAVLPVGGSGRSLTWRTWHTYPRDLRIVATESRLELR
jgi:Protein of unknown function DUF2617